MTGLKEFIQLDWGVSDQAWTVLAYTSVFLCSVLCTFIVVATTKHHREFTGDRPAGIQKIHQSVTPRIGGLGIYLALFFAVPLIGSGHKLLHGLLLAALPAFIAGFVEDLTGRINPQVRLAATICSGVLACLLTGYHLTMSSVLILSTVLSVYWLSVIFTALSVAGVANAFNIVDGYNGLTGFSTLLLMTGLGTIAHHANDFQVASLCVVIGCGTAGFLVFNWPRGKIFLGDGGAYLLGFTAGFIAVMLVERNESVSPFSALLVCIYPITEVIFSVLRRRSRQMSPSRPDKFHLHSLLGRRLIMRRFAHLSGVTRNSVTGVFMAMLSLPSTLVAPFIYHSAMGCLSAITLFVVFYTCVYRYLVKFRSQYSPSYQSTFNQDSVKILRSK